MTNPESQAAIPPVETLTLRGEAAIIDLRYQNGQLHLPATDPANVALSEADIQGKALVAIEAGAQRFVVTDISEATAVEGTTRSFSNLEPFGTGTKVARQSPTRYRLPAAHPYVLFHFAEDGSVTGRAIEPGSPIVLGSGAAQVDHKSARFEYANDLTLAPLHTHLQMMDYEGENLQVTSLDNHLPTVVRHSLAPGADTQERRRLAPHIGDLVSGAFTSIPNVRETGPVVPDYDYAREEKAYELWMDTDNGGNTFDLQYMKHYKMVRERLVKEFASGDLYRDVESFKRILSEIHTSLGITGIYNKVNKSARLQPEDFGRFRDGEDRPMNRRIERSLNVVNLAAAFGDPYGADRRLERGKPNSESYSYVHLPGISRQNLPYDVVRYDAKGDRRENGGYQYFYPNGNALDEYMTQITRLGQGIERAIKQGSPNLNPVLQLIGRQYQYGACDRSFKHVNNSIFMELANAQQKMLGLKGMTHGELDIAAQRMQPDTFARYFAARALGRAR